MSTRTVNLDTYSLSLLTAKEDILNPRSSTNWAIFTYDGVTNKLKLADSGAGGVAELAGKFHISKPQYGLCIVASMETGGPRIALISWVGQNVEAYRRTECASHIPAIKSFFKEAHAFISAEKMEDVTEEKIRAELSKSQAHSATQWVRRSRSADKEEIVGTNYRKTNAAMEMRLINRDSFWARAEREEEDRKEEERRRAAEDRRRLEKERILKERKDAEERDRKMNEKLQMIEEQRRKQAEQEEALLRKEKFKWEQQQKEHEEHMRARLRRSESIEKAAEAAALVSQRSMNPREFFRQLSSSSQSPTSPGSSRTGKPFRRYQRSLTDTAFIFHKAEENTASSPRSSPLVSPFSRAAPSPVYRATSPPTSPDFRPATSPQRPKAPVSLPTSPVRPAPPVSAMSSVPQADNQVVEPKSPAATEPSAPPASPTLLASLSPSLVKKHLSQSNPEALPASPPNTPTQPEHSAFCFEAGLALQAPTAPLPERPQPNTDLDTATPVHTELVSDTRYKVQAVLVEEDEEEDVEEHETDVAETQPQPCAATTEPVQTEPEEQEEKDKKEEQEEKDKREEQEEEDKKEEQEEKDNKEEQEEEYKKEEQEEKDNKEEEEDNKEEEQVEEDKKEEEEEKEQVEVEKKEEKEEEEEGLKEEDASLEEPSEVLQEEEEAKGAGEENDQSGEPAEPAELLEEEEESAVMDAEPTCPDLEHESVAPSTNGITNGDDTQERNGIERSLSPSDTELSSPELAVRYDLHCTAEDEDVIEEKEQEVSENGQEVLSEQQMCVRALYDYQAEDESEISFEPGDIIRDVETVDKAWWRGWSKDGRQGLFPANYVETI